MGGKWEMDEACGHVYSNHISRREKSGYNERAAFGETTSVSGIHESLERFFQGSIRVLGSEDGIRLTWKEVVEFVARHPKALECQGSLNGSRKFSMRGVVVEVTEAAYLAIRSGMPDQYLAPIPIREDIGKELANVKAVQERANRLNHKA